MAIAYNMSDVQQFNIVRIGDQYAIELQMKFVRMHLIIDDRERFDALLSILHQVPEEETRAPPPPKKMPKLYKGG